jgi:hypothetical protein
MKRKKSRTHSELATLPKGDVVYWKSSKEYGLAVF